MYDLFYEDDLIVSLSLTLVQRAQSSIPETDLNDLSLVLLVELFQSARLLLVAVLVELFVFQEILIVQIISLFSQLCFFLSHVVFLRVQTGRGT